MSKIRVSVVQACTAQYSLELTLEKLASLAAIAKNRDGSQLAVFPEAFIGGYPKGSTFSAVIGARAPEGREEFLRYHSAAIEIPSPSITRVEKIAAEHDIFLVVGVIERDIGGTLYCSVVFVDPVKGYLTKHRKLMPTGTERLVWSLGDGTTLPVLAYQFPHLPRENPQEVAKPIEAKMSAAICWENYMPLLRTFYYKQGTQLYCAPTVDARPEWQSTVTHIALEGRCFVLAACQFARQKDYPPNHAIIGKKVDPEAIMIAGGSVIVGPLGKVLAGPLREKEDVLTAEIDLDDCIRGKFDLDVTGHYARDDIFELRVKV